MCTRPWGAQHPWASHPRATRLSPSPAAVHATFSCLGKQASSAGNPLGEAPAPLPETPQFLPRILLKPPLIGFIQEEEKPPSFSCPPHTPRGGLPTRAIASSQPSASSRQSLSLRTEHPLRIHLLNLHTGAIRYVLGDEETKTSRGQRACEGHTASKWESWDSGLDSVCLEPVVLGMKLSEVCVAGIRPKGLMWCWTWVIGKRAR